MDHSHNIDTYPMKGRDKERAEGVSLIIQLLRTNPMVVVEPVPEMPRQTPIQPAG